MTTNTGIKAIAATLTLALATTAAITLSTPQKAFANDGSECYAPVEYQDDHYEGESVTIWPDSTKPVYAEWHQDDTGDWWATFWTYNYTKVYAKPAPAGCGWVFFAKESDGSFTQIIRYDVESSAEGEYGPNGIASHWQELDGTRWY